MEADIEIQMSQVEPYNGIEEQESEICEVCYLPVVKFVTLSECGHRFCETCVNTAFDSYLMGGRVTISCLQCSRPANPNEIKENLTPELYDKYLEFSLRRYLILQKNVRHCTAPDCPFAYIIDNPSNCEDDHFICLREGCGTEYCIKCNRPWHEGISCNKAKSKRQKDKPNGVEALGKDVMKEINVKLCPRCNTAVEKVDDGACNHVVCSICSLGFCWLCLKPGSEMHYLSPTGCPMYGRRRWSWWKRWGFRLILWSGAPFLMLLIALLVFFIGIFLIPLLVAYLVYSVLSKKCLGVTFGILSAVVVFIFSPFLSLILALIVIPIGLFYVYIFIPVHLILTNTRGVPTLNTEALV